MVLQTANYNKDFQFTAIEKKNGAARLDPWEIFLLLALKTPFHFISLRKLENYLQFYMTIVFKLNRTKKKFNINLNSPSI